MPQLIARNRLIILLLACFLALAFAQGARAAVGTATATVAIASATTDAAIDSAVREAVALAGGLPAGVAYGKSIVIHPNLVQAGWASGTGPITHAEVVRAIIRMCIERGASVSDITVCEGSASYRPGSDTTGYTDRQMTLKAFRDCGLDTNGDMLEDQTGVQLVDANNAGQVYPSFPGYSGPYNSSYVTKITNKPFLINRTYVIPNIVAQADVLIQVPVLKTHALAGVTGALKLSFGYAPTDIYHYPGLNYYKWALLHLTSWGDNELTTNAKGMADMTLARPPDLVVMDALVGITNGPCGGSDGNGGYLNIAPGGPMRCIFASKDPVAHDTVETLACWFRTDAASVPGLTYARALNLGENNPARIEVRGKKLSEVRRRFPTWGSADMGDTTAPIMGDLTVDVGSDGLLEVTPVGSWDASPGVAKGELYVDGVLADSNHLSPYSTDCLIKGSAGSHTVTYTLYDGMLNEVSLQRTIQVAGSAALTEVLSAGDGETVFAGPAVFAGRTPALGENTFFVLSKSGVGGMRVQCSGPAPDLAIGQSVSLFGALGTVHGQRVLLCETFKAADTVSAVRPLGMQNKAIGGAGANALTPGVEDPWGPYNLGCLVQTFGVAGAGGDGYFTLDDGTLPGGLKVLCGNATPPAAGTKALVTGFSCADDSGGTAERMLVVRSAADIVTF